MKWYIKACNIVIDIDPIEGSYGSISNKLRDMEYVESLGIDESFWFETFTLVDADKIKFPEFTT